MPPCRHSVGRQAERRRLIINNDCCLRIKSKSLVQKLQFPHQTQYFG
ncbi:hypothetical protein HMPREF9193_01557 [Treponema lecithinolyticum ATCC 700332]|uniref:Uncharacterized protein n=1 Tax=Treponema lecithinolyticum ATCC 700332 TaxID=1321815 RepID=A0ABN0NY04_TRELE|nr:hypothetical protein HMPREF9193_01557 [Treponema lecithinolyticum ATCC 700332]